MKSSRKGTKLNDAHYFRQPLPHTRKQMTAMCLMPQVSNMELNNLFVMENFTRDPHTKFVTGIKNCNKKLDLRRSSVEIAFLSYDNDREDEFSRKNMCSVSVATDTISKDTYLCDRIDSQIKMLKSKNEREKSEAIKNFLAQRSDVNEKQEREKKRGWWKEGTFGQAIFYFLSYIFGRRSTSSSMKYKARKSNLDMQCVLDTKGNLAIWNDESEKKEEIINSYILDDDCEIVNSKSREEIILKLVRQIERTRDKNLRVTLLEEEFWTRFQTRKLHHKTHPETKKYASRKISSPLC